MCVGPLKQISGLGLAGQAVKTGGPAGVLSPGLALLGAFGSKKKKPQLGSGPNPDGSMSAAGGY